MVELRRRDSLGWHIAVLGRKMAAHLDKELKQYDLKISYWPTLFLLWEQEGLSQTELAQACMTEHYTTTRILDKLEILGLIERRSDPNSRRTFRIYLTDKGRELEQPLTQLARQVNDRFLDRLPEEDRAPFIRMMQEVNGD